MRITCTISFLFSLSFFVGCRSVEEVYTTKIDPSSVALSLHKKGHDLKEIRLTNTSENDLEFLIVTRMFPGALVLARDGENPRYFVTSQFYEMMIRGIPRPDLVRLAPSEYIRYNFRTSDLVPLMRSDSTIAENDLVRVDLLLPGGILNGISSRWYSGSHLLKSEQDDADNPVKAPDNPKNQPDD